MLYLEDGGGFDIEIHANQCELDEASRTKILASLNGLIEALEGFDAGRLHIDVYRDRAKHDWHVKFCLRLPRQRLFTGGRDTRLQTASQACSRQLLAKVRSFRAQGALQAGGPRMSEPTG